MKKMVKEHKKRQSYVTMLTSQVLMAIGAETETGDTLLEEAISAMTEILTLDD